MRRDFHRACAAAGGQPCRAADPALPALPASCGWLRAPRRRSCRRPCRECRSGCRPPRRSTATRYAVVVLPLVPVMPTTRISRARISVERDSQQGQRETRIWHRSPTAHRSAAGGGCSETIATAPRSIAWCANSAPSACSPLSATNTFPGSTARESYAMPVTKTSARIGGYACIDPMEARVRAARRAVQPTSWLDALARSSRRRTLRASAGRRATRRAASRAPDPATRRSRRPTPGHPSRAGRACCIASRALNPRRSGSVRHRRAVGDQADHRRRRLRQRGRRCPASSLRATSTGGSGFDRCGHAEILQRRFGDPLENRRRHGAAGVSAGPCGESVDDDDRDRRIARRHEADERRVVLGRRIAAVDELRRRAGLAGDRVAGNLRRSWRCRARRRRLP